jgi:ATP-dependent DNA ligase
VFEKLMQPYALKKNLYDHIEIVNDLLIDESWIMEKKYDGRRFQFIIDNDKICFADKYAQLDKTNISIKISETLNEVKKLKLPNKTHLDIELLIPGKFEESLSLYRGDIKNALHLQNKLGNAIIRVIDILYFEQDLTEFPLYERKKIISQLFSNCEFIIPVEGFIDRKVKEEKFLSIFNAEEDGVVFKLLEAPYIYGTSKLWYKYKRVDSYDVVIMNISEREGQYSGMAKCITVGQYKNGKLCEVAHVGNMDIETRYFLWNNKEKLKGNVIEIFATKRTKIKYKDTRFSRFRDDKNSSDCIWE